MAALKNPDFIKKKKASGGDFKGKNYQEILKLKIQKKRPFLLGATGNGGEVYGISAKIENGTLMLSYAKSKTSKKIQAVAKITNFFKDPDFGGGKGSGGGAEDTAFTESIQCYYLSLAFNKNFDMTKKITMKDLESQHDFCHTYKKGKRFKLKELYQGCPDDWFDKNVFEKTAIAVKASKAGKKFAGKKVYFHRGSPFMDAIYDNKKQAQKWDKENNVVTLAPGSFSDDKWNPGDIWMSTLKPDSEEPFEGTPLEWVTLREAVFDSAKKAKCLGVSLKKVESGAAKVVEFNLPKRKHNVSVSFKGYVFGQTGDFFNSADVYLHFSTGIMQCRATATTSSWQGEMKGKFAAMGKIGGGNLNYYTELFFKNSIASTSIEKNWKEISYTDGDLNKMYELYKRFINNQMLGIKTQKVVSKAEFKKSADNYINPKGKKASEAFYFGKFMCLLFLESINADKKGANLNKLSTEIVRYAQSNTDISSYFVKVS